MLDDGTPVLALVPARGGSRGIPRKNLAPLRGRPLLQWTIEAATGSRFVDRTTVSSDDGDILCAAHALGAESLQRPGSIASDDASPVAVVLHFLDSIDLRTRSRDPVIVYLQPTSPLRTSHHLDDALSAMVSAGARCTMSVAECAHSPFKAFRLDDTGRLQSLFDESLSNARRQDLPRTFQPNGAIYAFPVSAFVERGGFPSNGAVPYLMSSEASIDIDRPEDLRIAELILEPSDG
jgi:CMP-N,N'-diacetyllegionaminic acid synthase